MSIPHPGGGAVEAGEAQHPTALYNEIMSGRVRSAGNAFDQARHGKSGRGPKPFPATCSFHEISTPLADDAQACARYQARGSHRSSRTKLELRGSTYETGLSYFPATALPWFGPDSGPPQAAAARGMCERFWLRLPCGIHPSTATCCVGLGRFRTKIHTCGSCARPLDCCHATSAISPYKTNYSISDWGSPPAKRSRRSRISVPAASFDLSIRLGGGL